MRRLWMWISDPKNQKNLAFLGGALVAIVGAGWSVYAELWKSSPPSPTRMIQNACGVATAGGDVTITGITCSFGVTLAEYEEALAKQEKKLRAQLKAASDDAKKRLSLEQDLSITLKRRQDVKAAFKEQGSALTELAASLERGLPSEGVTDAFSKAIESGDTTALENELRSELRSNVQQAANRAYQLGILLRKNGQFSEAHEAFNQARKLAPNDAKIGETLASTEKRLDVLLGSGKLRLSAVLSEDGEAVSAEFVFYKPEQDLDGNRQRVAYDSGIGKWFTLPAGRYFLKTTSGSAVRKEFIDIVGGRETNKVIDLDASRLRLSAVLSEGGKAVSAEFVFYKPEQDLDGNRQRVTYDSGIGKWFTLPAGRYFLKTTSGSAVREEFIDVVGGRETNKLIDLDASRLRLSAALPEDGKAVSAEFVIYKPEQDLDGKRQRVTYDSGIGKWFTLPAGRYFLKTTSGSAVREEFIDVVGGSETNKIVELRPNQ